MSSASTRPLYAFSLAVDVVSANMVNEVSAGLTAVGGSGSRFGQPNDPSQGVGSFADIGGNALVIPLATDWWTVNSPSWRAAPTYNLGTNLSWQKSKHSISVGGGWLRSSAWESAQQIVPQINLGFNNTFEPAIGTVQYDELPGCVEQRPDQRARGSTACSRAASPRLTTRLRWTRSRTYVLNSARKREGYLDVWSVFAQDQWRVKPTVTISAGLRWDLQTPFKALNDTMTAVAFDSVCGQSGRGEGTTPFNKCAFNSYKNIGMVPEYIQLTSGTNGYETDWNNLGPSISVAWRPNVQSGFMRTLLGDPEQATLRGGYSQTYSRQGISTFTGTYGGNPGSTISVNRNVNNGNLIPAGGTWPLLLRDKDEPVSGDVPDHTGAADAVLPNRANSLNAFAEDVQIDSARTFSVSFQRAITRDMAVDVRYVGTRGVDQWSTLNYNTRDIEANGFFNEFKAAVANLKANNIAGGSRTGSFAYFGAGTGTNPLPIYMVYLLGSDRRRQSGRCTRHAVDEHRDHRRHGVP